MKFAHPIDFIELVQRTFGRYPEYSGGCLKFHIMFCQVFPEAEGWYDSCHVLSFYGGKYWDIDGEYTKSLDNFLPIKHHWSGLAFIEQFHEYIGEPEKRFLISKYGVRRTNTDDGTHH